MQGVGYPFLAVLDGASKVVTRQKTDPLEEGDHHDPAKVKAFLKEWSPPRLAASKVLEDGLAKASSEDKLAFLHFGSPTCGWCTSSKASSPARIWPRSSLETSWTSNSTWPG